MGRGQVFMRPKSPMQLVKPVVVSCLCFYIITIMYAHFFLTFLESSPVDFSPVIYNTQVTPLLCSYMVVNCSACAINMHMHEGGQCMFTNESQGDMHVASGLLHTNLLSSL